MPVNDFGYADAITQRISIRSHGEFFLRTLQRRGNRRPRRFAARPRTLARLIRLGVTGCCLLGLGCASLLAGQPPTAESIGEGAKSQAQGAAQNKADEAAGQAIEASGTGDLRAGGLDAAGRVRQIAATPEQLRQQQAARIANKAHTTQMARVPRGTLPWSKARKRYDEQAAAAPLAIGAWEQGLIRCGKGACEDLYWVHLPDDLRVMVEANGPTEAGFPDFGLSLLDASLEVINLNRAAGRRSRMLDERLPSGIYYVKIFALEKSDLQLSYQLRVQPFTERAAAPTMPASAPETKGDSGEPAAEKARSAPSPAPPTISLRAEILDVERKGDTPVAVLVDAGIAQGVRSGMRGRLIDRGKTLGRIEFQEVYSAGSRARIVGAVSGEIGQDTRAVVQIPAP
jgi:hypothetical protein